MGLFGLGIGQSSSSCFGLVIGRVNGSPKCTHGSASLLAVILHGSRGRLPALKSHRGLLEIYLKFSHQA